MGGKNDDFNVRIFFQNHFCKVQAVDKRHFNIGDDDIRFSFGNQLQCLVCAGYIIRNDIVQFLPWDADPQQSPHFIFIVYKHHFYGLWLIHIGRPPKTVF